MLCHEASCSSLRPAQSGHHQAGGVAQSLVLSFSHHVTCESVPQVLQGGAVSQQVVLPASRLLAQPSPSTHIALWFVLIRDLTLASGTKNSLE